MRNSSGVVFLIAGGNWNNGTKAGVTYLNSNNVASNSNRNISSQPNSPEQHFNLYSTTLTIT
jgi:hypothetical protein